ncbi:MAG: malonyl-CoA decarboxylase family protein [Alphaproteobacteria bacterium]
MAEASFRNRYKSLRLKRRARKAASTVSAAEVKPPETSEATTPAVPRLLDRTLNSLRVRGWWERLAGSVWGGDAAQAAVRPDLPDEDADRLRGWMRTCLDARGGEVSARARAAGLGRSYLSLNQQGRAKFLKILATEFGSDRTAVDQAVAHLQHAESAADRRIAESGLRHALETSRSKLLTQFNGLPEGVKFLVDLRADLLPLVKNDPDMGALAEELKGLLTAWFDVGFLELRRITWRSSAALLEKLIAYEAVHAIASWDDLKNRLDSDRRCFGFFHPRMPDEPLIFVEVALTKGMAGNVQALLDQTAPVLDPTTADTAIFYSISNAQQGLNGISFGNFLIKRVVDQILLEFPNIKTFATLSPIPGFRRWLEDHLAATQPVPQTTPKTASSPKTAMKKRYIRPYITPPFRGKNARAVSKNSSQR